MNPDRSPLGEDAVRQALLELDEGMHPLALHHFRAMKNLPYGELIHSLYFKRHHGWGAHWRSNFQNWFGDANHLWNPSWRRILNHDKYEPENSDDNDIQDENEGESDDLYNHWIFMAEFDTAPGIIEDYSGEIDMDDDDSNGNYSQKRGARHGEFVERDLWGYFKKWAGSHHGRHLWGSKQFYHQDALGSTWAVTDAWGGARKKYNYDAWGNLVSPSSGFPFSDIITHGILSTLAGEIL